MTTERSWRLVRDISGQNSYRNMFLDILKENIQGVNIQIRIANENLAAKALEQLLQDYVFRRERFARFYKDDTIRYQIAQRSTARLHQLVSVPILVALCRILF